MHSNPQLTGEPRSCCCCPLQQGVYIVATFISALALLVFLYMLSMLGVALGILPDDVVDSKAPGYQTTLPIICLCLLYFYLLSKAALETWKSAAKMDQNAAWKAMAYIWSIMALKITIFLAFIAIDLASDARYRTKWTALWVAVWFAINLSLPLTAHFILWTYVRLLKSGEPGRLIAALGTLERDEGDTYRNFETEV